MKHIEIIAFTPRAGEKGHRIIVSTDCNLTDRQVNNHIRNTSEKNIPNSYVVLSKQVEQIYISGSKRIGTEKLISVCLDENNEEISLSESIKSDIYKILENNHEHFVKNVIESTNWEKEGREKIVIRNAYIDSIKNKVNSLLTKENTIKNKNKKKSTIPYWSIIIATLIFLISSLLYFNQPNCNDKNHQCSPTTSTSPTVNDNLIHKERPTYTEENITNTTWKITLLFSIALILWIFKKLLTKKWTHINLTFPTTFLKNRNPILISHENPKKDLYNKPSISEINISKINETYENHEKDYYSIYLISSGIGSVSIDIKPDQNIKTGDILIIPPNKKVIIRNQSETLLTLLYMR